METSLKYRKTRARSPKNPGKNFQALQPPQIASGKPEKASQAYGAPEQTDDAQEQTSLVEFALYRQREESQQVAKPSF